ncbi:hypothetical protein D3C74_140160 [compost metagenome]
MKLKIAILAIVISVALSGCGNNVKKRNTAQGNNAVSSNMNMDHSGMNHFGSGEIPEGLQEASNPKYKIGSQAKITDDHMPGMKGATATIVDAYDTIVYVVSYNPVNGGDPVKNHQWVTESELTEP